MSDDLTTNALGTKDGTSVVTPTALKEAVELLDGRCSAIDKHYARFPDSLDRTMEDTAKAIRTILATLSSQAESLEAMASAGEPFAFYYDVNDLHERSNEDAIEVPVGDLRRVTTTLSQYRKTGDL